jgi:ribosome modulation factor
VLKDIIKYTEITRVIYALTYLCFMFVSMSFYEVVMQRTKRNRDNRAYKQGMNQGIKGHAKEACPFQQGTRRGEWMGGWRVGHACFIAGYRGDMTG